MRLIRQLGNQLRALLQGWPKATPAMRKRLLRRTVKAIVVTQEEMEITFWLSAEERDESLPEGAETDPSKAKKILALYRPGTDDPNDPDFKEALERAKPSPAAAGSRVSAGHAGPVASISKQNRLMRALPLKLAGKYYGRVAPLTEKAV